MSEETIACLERAIQEPEEEKPLLERIRETRAAMAARGVCITDEEITAWKRQGRP